MATRIQIEDHYDTVGALHALRMEDVQGGYPDYTCALFDGDFSKTYAQAQLDKHAWILDSLKLGQDLTGKRILDIGCGWGPILNAVRKRGGESIGLTLSPAQTAYCLQRGLDARLKDYKDLAAGEPGIFDGIISVGAFEHFCSVDEMLAGRQDAVYRSFFRICAERLREGGRLYLQTMTWGRRVPDYHSFSLNAPADSTEAILARMEHLYPGSWPPDGLPQLIECAGEHFDFVSSRNGRLDYIETLKRWEASTPNLWKPRVLPRTLRHGIPLMFSILASRGARIRWQSIRRGDQRASFAREIMSHERMVFVRKRPHEAGHRAT
ncbi:MAG: SAM-dependent methyltransferase [Gemmatimonadota bacterium]